jgi:hypothetical protein
LVGEVFPSMAFLARQPRTIAVWHPRGPHETEVWRWYLVDKAAPDEVKDFLRDYYIRYSGPAGMTEQDDMENWNYASAASAGMMARKYPYHYKAALGVGRPSGDYVPGSVVRNPHLGTEQNPRMLYKRWSEYMDAGDWGDLLPATQGA